LAAVSGRVAEATTGNHTVEARGDLLGTLMLCRMSRLTHATSLPGTALCSVEWTLLVLI